MKCMSRSTLGVVIGVINIVLYIIASIGCLVNLVVLNAAANSNQGRYQNHYDEDDDLYSFSKKYNDLSRENEKNNFAVFYGNIMFSVLLVVCLVMILISALLVMGIIKKRHILMTPWLILSAIGFVVSCFRSVQAMYIVMTSPVPFGIIFYTFGIICVTLGLQALIIYAIYTLYRDIRSQNNESPGQVITATSVGYPVQTPYYSPIPPKA